jgi:erythromycin esterase-like protein
MDLYSLYRSIDEVLLLLGRLDPEAARRARDRYGCFEQYLDDPQRYGYAASFDMTRSCQEQVLQQLREISRRGGDPEDRFFLEQNARLVADAEAYYRAMFASREASWNLRDTHMAGTVDALAAHLEETSGAPARLVLWAHNSHLGDARATEMGWSGEHNVGQLLRYRHGDAVFNVGFTTHKGRVTAARDWGEPPRHLHVQPSLPGSHERLLHEVGEGGDFFLVTRGAPDPARMFGRRLERAIGVIYRPETERWSHYFEADLATQFDAVVHFDVTHAVEPLERMQVWDPDRAETFPTGL